MPNEQNVSQNKMTDNSNQYDISPALLRQRRNLLIVSMLLLFLKMSGAELQSISLVGLKATFKNPEAVLLFLQFFLCYFFYRYYLYIIQEPKLFIKEIFYSQLNKYTHLKLQKIKDNIYL